MGLAALERWTELKPSISSFFGDAYDCGQWRSEHSAPNSYFDEAKRKGAVGYSQKKATITHLTMPDISNSTTHHRNVYNIMSKEGSCKLLRRTRNSKKLKLNKQRAAMMTSYSTDRSLITTRKAYHGSRLRTLVECIPSMKDRCCVDRIIAPNDSSDNGFIGNKRLQL